MSRLGTQACEYNDSWEIRLTFVDEKLHRFTFIGGGEWATENEQMCHWSAIPEFPIQKCGSFIAARFDRDTSTVLSVKQVSARTCEILLGQSIESLISDGRGSITHAFVPSRRSGLFSANDKKLSTPSLVLTHFRMLYHSVCNLFVSLESNNYQDAKANPILNVIRSLPRTTGLSPWNVPRGDESSLAPQAVCFTLYSLAFRCSQPPTRSSS